ncbi:MAG: hypothetical protein RLW61_02120 [Gammaproteobacteria bacterium]
MTMTLPAQFSELEPYCADWVLPDSGARHAKRLASEYADIKAFYDAMLEAAPDALAYLAERQLGQLDAADTNLLKLMLALAEVGPAVEWYQQPAVIDGWPGDRFPLIEAIPDTAAQEI